MFGRLRTLEKPVVFKCVWMALLLVLNAHQRAYIHAGNTNNLELIVGVDLVSFAAGDFCHVIFLGLVLNTFGADAPAFEGFSLVSSSRDTNWNAALRPSGRNTLMTSRT